ncbi:MAG: DUF362 domain-containing protein [Treponema sp.]|nr:DUF362 domain-containing protein [Treponema sp.]
MTKTVVLQKCKNYTFDDVFACVKKMLELLPPPDVKGKIVLLKPNILYPKKPELAVGTHPVVVGAAVKAFLERGAEKVLVGESPAIANSYTSAKLTGMLDQVVFNGGEWADFHDSIPVACPDGVVVKQFEFARQFDEADIVVSMSKLKTHQLMSYTGAMKNLFGLVIGLDKAKKHYQFPNKEDFGNYLIDLNIAANADYAIMDAIVGMEGPGGPGSGDPVQLGFLAASDNLLALDWKCSSLVGYDPHKIVYLEQALKRGYWLKSDKEIKTIGAPENECRSTTFKIVKDPVQTLGGMLPKTLDVIAEKYFVKTPHFNSKRCRSCGRCEQICPAHDIDMEGPDGTARLKDKTKCIHCFCCHEICSFGAIKLRRF